MYILEYRKVFKYYNLLNIMTTKKIQDYTQQQREIIKQIREQIKSRSVKTTDIINKVFKKITLTEEEQKFLEVNRVLNSELKRLCQDAYNTL